MAFCKAWTCFLLYAVPCNYVCINYVCICKLVAEEKLRSFKQVKVIMQWIFSEKNTLCFFWQFFEQMQYTSNQQHDSFMYKCKSSKILRHSRHEQQIITDKSYSSTDPMWSSSSRSSRLVNSHRCTHNVTIQEFLEVLVGHQMALLGK